MCLAAFLLTSCATIFNPLMQDVDVTSSVPEASVWIDGELEGTAPIVLHISTNQRHEVIVRTENQSKVWVLEPTTSGTGVGGLIGDGLILVGAGVGATNLLVVAAVGGALSGGADMGQSTTVAALGIAVGVAGLAPLVVDLATNNLYELQPSKLDAVF